MQCQKIQRFGLKNIRKNDMQQRKLANHCRLVGRETEAKLEEVRWAGGSKIHLSFAVNDQRERLAEIP